jgi:sugar O-acyltransferase (sialic acid O-acetyltransferase NeuD family)
MKSHKRVVVMGGGYGFYEVFSLINTINSNSESSIEIIGILDDNTSLKNRRGIPVVGALEDWINFDDEIFFVFAIGSFNTRMYRKSILERIQIPHQRFLTLIHPSSEIMIPVDSIGAGCIIHSGVKIYALTAIGALCTISANCVVGIANIIGSYSLFASGVYTATNIKFGMCSFLGTSSVVAPNVHIGCGAQIGVGSAVFRDVEPGHKVVGNPAKAYGKDDVPLQLLELAEHDINLLQSLSASQL